MKAAKQVIVVADHTKFNRKSLVLFGKLKEVELIVTDKGIDKKSLRKLEKRELKVLTILKKEKL